MRIGTNELLIILVVALLIFGPKNLPKLGKMFGKTINGFKKGMEDEVKAENEVLRREAAALREQLEKMRNKEARREERAQQAAQQSAAEGEADKAE